MREKKILRTVSAWLLSASLMPGAVFGAQTASDSQTIDPGEILSGIFHQVSEEAERITIPAFEGNIHVEAADGLRTAISDHYYSEDDMSWIQDADLFVQGAPDETGGADLEATFYFNDTELYHLQAAYDREKNDLYLVCPELKEEVLAFPIGDFSADAQTLTGKKITPEMIADYTSALKELNDLIRSITLEEVQYEAQKYLSALAEYVSVDRGVSTVTAGSLSAEGHTTTWTIEEGDIREMIPQALRLLSEDALLKKILQSPFAEHMLRLFVKNKALSLLPEGALYNFARQALLKSSENEYDWGRTFSVTLALDREKRPIHLSASLQQAGMQAELFQINAILDGADHALEVKAGPVLAKRAGFRTKMSSGVLVQGSLKDDMLRETVSLHVNGMTLPLVRIQGLDLLALQDMWPEGLLSVIWDDIEYSCDFFTDEEGIRTMVFTQNGTEWFRVTADLRQVESTSLDVIDREDVFTVDSRKAFFKYIRNASALRMFEKLASAGVPQEYVDMLTDGEAATESSRENTEELEAEE